MDNDRIVKRIYRESKNRLEREEAESKHNEDTTRTKTWCRYTKQLMYKLKLDREWHTEQIPEEDEWNSVVREKIHEREQYKWRVNCLLKPKLRTYSKLKSKLRVEPYLDVYHRSGIPELAKLRGGTNRLRIEQGRYVKEAVEDRKCMFCVSGEVEDETHFMISCAAYSDLRRKLWTEFEEVTGTAEASFETNEQKMNALIGERFQPEEGERKTARKPRFTESA